MNFGSITKLPFAAWVALALVIAMLTSGGYAFAKYVLQKTNDVVLAADSFYLESDLLADSKEAMPRYTLQAGVDDITFKVMNHPDELRTSAVDITCVASLTKDGTPVDGKSENITLTKDITESKTVVFSDLKPGTYVATVSESTPYDKSLRAEFTIVGLSTGLKYTVSDGEKSPFLMVTIETTDYSGNAQVEWPDGVLPDNTDPLLSDATGKSCTIALKKNSEYSLLFFKTNPNVVYSNDNISVTATA